MPVARKVAALLNERRSVLVATIDLAGRGGVYAMAAEFDGMLERMGKSASFLYLSGSAGDNSLSPRRLIRRGKLWDTKRQQSRGLDGMAVGHLLAHFQSLVYFWPYPSVRRYANSFGMHLVLGSAMAGFTLAWMRKPYVCWLSTLYEDEQRARAEGGDELSWKHVNSISFKALRWQERFVLRRARLIAAISDHTAERVRMVYPETSHKVEVVNVPVDVGTFRPTDRSPAQPTALWVGRVEDARKNVQMALSAFQKVVDRMPNARLVIAGARAGELSTLTERLGIKGSVELQPSVETPSQMAELYRRADVFLLSSRQEGLGIVVEEAMASGLPIVSTRCGGPESLVRDSDAGLLVSTDDSEGLASSLLTLFQDPARGREMGARARASALAIFSRKAVERRFQELFEKVYGEAPRRAVPAAGVEGEDL